MDLFRKRQWLKKRKHWLATFMILLCLSACSNVPRFSTIPLQHDILFLNVENKEIQALELTGDFHIFIPEKYKNFKKEIQIMKEEKTIDMTPVFEDVEAGVIAKVSLEEAGNYQLKLVVTSDDKDRITKESEAFKLILMEDIITWDVTSPHEEGYAKDDIELHFERIEKQTVDKVDVVLVGRERETRATLDWKEQQANYVMDKEDTYVVRMDVEIDGSKVSKLYEDRILVLDRSIPKLSMRIHDQDITKPLAYHYDEEVMVELVVEDANLIEHKSEVSVNGELVDMEWKEGRGALYLKQSGNYVIELYASDRCGNDATILSSELVIDVDTAVIAMFIDGKQIRELPSYVPYELQIDVEIQEPFMDLKQSFIQDQEEKMDVKWQKDGDTYKTSLNLAEGKHKLIVEAIDQGMRKSRLESNEVMIDTTAPKSTIRYAFDQEIFREDQVMHIEIVDMSVKEEDVQLMMTLNHEEIQPTIQWEHRDNLLLGEIRLDQEGEYAVDLKIQDKAGNASVFRKQAQSEFQSAFAVDHFVLDKSRPSVKVSYDEHKESASYAKHRQASIVVQDKNFSEDLIQLQVKRDEKLEEMNIVWESKDDVHTGVVQFQKDGEYSIALEVKDRAQNTAMYQVQEQFQETYPDDIFLIDTMVPQIHVTGMPTSTFIKQDVTLEYLVEDEHLQEYTFLVMRNSALYLPALRIGEETSKQSITIPANDMGTYEVKLVALDTSGNQSVMNLERFIMDSQAPLIELYVDKIPVADEFTYTSNQSSKISIAWSDEYLKNASIVLSKDGVVQPLTIGKERFEMDLVIEKDRDVFYDLKIMMEDEAGNQSTRQLQLHQDSFLPKLEIANDIFQGKATRSSWTPQLKYEKDEFHVMEASLYRNQRAVLDYMWGDEIHEEGAYTLRVSVRDEAMNEAYLLPFFQFTIDKTPPEIRFTSADDTRELEEFKVGKEDVLHLYVEDKMQGWISPTLRVDQEVIDSNTMKEDGRGKAYIPINFDEEKTYEVEVEAMDEAGNQSYRMEKVSVDKQNIPLLKENHKPVSTNDQSTRIAMMAGVILAVGFFIVVKKRYGT